MAGRTVALLVMLTLGGTMAFAQDRPANPLAPRAPFAGKYSGDGLTLELTAQGAGYAGTMTFQGQVMPCRAQTQGEGLSGTFEAGGGAFPFEAAPDGQGGLRLASGGKTYALRREGGPPNPLGGPAAGPGPAPAPTELPGEAKHPLGVAVRLPAGWTTLEQPVGVLLAPPGLTYSESSEEMYVLMAAPLDPSVTAVSDPRVAQYMDQVVQGLFPNLSRTKEPQTAQTGAGATLVMDWSGTAPSGKPVSARAYVAVAGQNGGAVLSVGVTSLTAPREAAVRAIAGTMKAFASEANPRLVGKWGNNGGWDLPGNHGTAHTYGSSRVEMTLGQGGQLHEFELRYVTTPAGVMESKEERRGRWQANGAILTLQYENGTVSQYRYQITEQGLVCTGANGGQVTWLPSR